MPLYFAYGSNMDRRAMARRCPGARVLGPARLNRHRLVIVREGYASVRRDPRQAVHGLVWDLPLRDVPALDRYEEIAGGLYVKAVQAVLTASGPRRTLIYLGCGGEGGTPRPGYLEGVLAAGREAGLPAGYLAALGALCPGGAGTPPRRSAPRSAHA